MHGDAALARTGEIAMIAEACGFDSFFIDMEHCTISLDAAAQIYMDGARRRHLRRWGASPGITSRTRRGSWTWARSAFSARTSRRRSRQKASRAPAAFRPSASVQSPAPVRCKANAQRRSAR
jgi:hypothetical protein